MKPKPRSARTPHLRCMADAFVGSLDAMTDDELRAVRREVKRLSQTNCWWLVYRLGPLAGELADGILRVRRRASRGFGRPLKAGDVVEVRGVCWRGKYELSVPAECAFYEMEGYFEVAPPESPQPTTVAESGEKENEP